MKSKSFLLEFICLIIQISAISQEEWTLQKDKNDIKVFTRKIENIKFSELKVECEFDGRLSQLAAVLLDVNNHYRWVYRTAKSQLLKAASPTDVFFYTEIQCPWPFENRDVVVHMTLKQNVETKVMTVEDKNIDNYLPHKKNIVRVNSSWVLWTVTPLNNKKFKIDYRIKTDPGGAIPAWLLNLFVTKGPYESFMKLREEIKLPQYRQARFTFLLD